MSDALVSIIIPVYKTEKTLSRCIDSALAQTYPNCEIVIVDDGTPDHAGEIADDYASKHTNILVVHKQNAGLAEARHSGVKAATGDYIIHVDSDDELLPDAVEFLLGKCITSNLDIVFGDHVRINERGEKNEIKHNKEGVLTGKEFLTINIELNGRCASWGCVAKRDLWLNDIYPPSDRKLPSEDVLINIKLSKYANRVGIFNHPVCYYYFNSSSLTSTGELSTLDKWKDYYSIIENELESRDLFTKYEPALLTQKIDRLAFYMNNLDTSDQWVKGIICDKRFKLPAKTRLLQFLIKKPQLWESIRGLKRRFFN